MDNCRKGRTNDRNDVNAYIDNVDWRYISEKKVILFSVVSLILLIGAAINFTYFNSGNKSVRVYQNIAWEALDKNHKDQIIGTNRDSEVKEETIDGKTRIYVSFHTESDGILGPITVIINPETRQSEGIGIRK